MPHQILELSANLEPLIDVRKLVEVLHQTTSSIDAFPLAGLRTRVAIRDHYKIADGHPDNGFIHLTLRIRHGRTVETRKNAGEVIFAALSAYLEPFSNSTPLAISFEIQEIHPDLNFKQNNLRAYMAERGTLEAQS